jgi:SAM-dependent methyltransferase
MFGLRHEFTYLRCSGCRSLWLSEIPGDLASYYGDGYYSMAPPRVRARGPAARRWVRMSLRLPPSVVDRVAGKRGFPEYLRWFQALDVSPSSRIADVGSGEGALIIRMAAHGFDDVWGFDPFIHTDMDYGNAHVRRVGIERADGFFDVIMFNHSLEHIARPIEALRNARSRLAAGGAILVRVPLAGTFADRQYGGDWVSLDAPRHLNVPSRQGMQAAAGASGLQITRVFFDSLPQQIWASEQYRRDIPLFDERGGPPQNGSRALRRRTRRLNRSEDGDRAGFVLRAK